MNAVTLVVAFSGGALLAGGWKSLRSAFQGIMPALPPAPDRPPPPLPPAWTPYGGARPELRGWPDDSVLAVRGLAKQSPEVIGTLLDVCEELGAPVDTVAAVIAHESGWNPGALYFQDKKDDGTPRKVPFVAAGLCQLTVAAHLEGFGDWERVREITSWPAERQLREVVRPLWAKYGNRVRGAHPGHGLMLNFLPDKAGGAESTVLGEKGAEGMLGAIYAMNRGFDPGGNGKITIGDVYASAARVCRATQGKRVRVDGSMWTPPAPPKKVDVLAATAALSRPAASSSTSTTAAKSSSSAASSSAAPSSAASSSAATTTAPSSPASSTTPNQEQKAREDKLPAEDKARDDKARVELVPVPGPAPAAAGGRRLGEAAGGLLLAAIRDGKEEAPTWVDLLWEGSGKTAGVKLMVRVSAHCVRAPVEIEGMGKRLLRLPISYREQIEVCRLRKWLPLTQSITSAIWAAARRIDPPVLGKWNTPEEQKDSSRRMMTLEWVVKFNDALDAQIPPDKWSQLWAPEGKEWILHNRVERPDGKGAVNYGLHRLNGTPWQPPGGAHDWSHYDYSQTLRAMECEATDPATGRKVSIVEVLRNAGMPAAVLAPFEGLS